MLTIETVDGEAIARMSWTADATPLAVTQWMARALQEQGLYSEPTFEPEVVFRETAHILDVLVRARLSRGTMPSDVGPVVEVPNDQWALTGYGLECLTLAYSIDLSLVHSDWIGRHMSEKVWIDMTKFSDALSIAREYLTPENGFPVSA
jgi:hypothetical protein